MASKPQNHVTHDLRARTRVNMEKMPEVSVALLEWLEAVHPAKCYAPGQEDLEAHLMYAGKVELIALLRSNQQARSDGDPGENALSEDDIEFLNGSSRLGGEP